ncbi:MFS transporter [Virgisporangium aurantiacum]|uniref:MFS transporter n=1 Tax=Virgisporangium aurantiacum TaxID=175570 RepID=UPI001EF1E74F|nr:MFS transporter [Virgisporangium aurantiacum]
MGFVKKHAIDVRALRYPAFRRLFIGNAVSFIGFQFTAVAVPVQMYAITDSSLWVGLIGIAGLVPLLIFALWGGAVADVRDRRSVLLASSTLMWTATLGLLVHALSGVDSPQVLLGLVAVQSAAFAISSPTRSAILPRLVPAEEVAAASTLGFTVSNIGQVLGPLGAGLVLAHGDFALAYGVDAALFTVAMWAALRLPEMPPAVRAPDAPTSRLGDLVDSLRYLRHQPVLLLTFAIDIAAMVLAMPRAVFPEVAAERFGGDKAVGWLYSAIAIGAVVAGLGSGWVTRVRRQGLVIVAAVVGWGLAVAVAGLAPALWLAVLGLALAGAADLVSAAFRQTILLTFAPDEMRGRMQGAFIAVVAGGPRLGDLRVGAMAATTGATVAWVSGGVAAAVVAVLLAVAYPALLRYTVREAER